MSVFTEFLPLFLVKDVLRGLPFYLGVQTNAGQLATKSQKCFALTFQEILSFAIINCMC